MQNEIIIALGLIAGYFLYRVVSNVVSKKQKSPNDAYSKHSQKYTTSDILTKDKYKVKGQWDK